MIDAFSLRKSIKQKEQLKNRTYESILEKCCRMIKRAAEDNPRIEYYEFVVPPFVVGEPLYDFDSCVEHIVRRLNQLGYRVSQNDRSLRVSWSDIRRIEKPIQRNSKPERAPVRTIERPRVRPETRPDHVTRVNDAPPPSRPNYAFPPPNQWLSSKLLDAHRPKLPHRREDDVGITNASLFRSSKKRNGKITLDFS